LWRISISTSRKTPRIYRARLLTFCTKVEAIHLLHLHARKLNSAFTGSFSRQARDATRDLSPFQSPNTLANIRSPNAPRSPQPSRLSRAGPAWRARSIRCQALFFFLQQVQTPGAFPQVSQHSHMPASCPHEWHTSSCFGFDNLLGFLVLTPEKPQACALELNWTKSTTGESSSTAWSSRCDSGRSHVRIYESHRPQETQIQRASLRPRIHGNRHSPQRLSSFHHGPWSSLRISDL